MICIDDEDECAHLWHVADLGLQWCPRCGECEYCGPFCDCDVSS